MTASLIERAVRRDRLLLIGVLGGLTLLAWAFMSMPEGATAGAERLMPCCGARFSVAFSMWALMMAGMMLPAVAPMVLTHAAIVRRRPSLAAPFASSGLFLAGYFVAWGGFSAVAALAQCALFRAHLLDGRSLSIGPAAGAVVLILAGLFQISRFKDACLAQCRAPLGYFMTEWRDGPLGAVRMGVKHGVFCLLCCWLLMAVLFVVGIMNLLWGAAITAFVIAERNLPWPRALVWSSSVGCWIGALVLLHRAVVAG